MQIISLPKHFLSACYLAAVLIVVLRFRFFFSPHETIKFFVFDLLLVFSLLFYLKRNIVKLNLLSFLALLTSFCFLFSVLISVNLFSSILWSLRFLGTLALVNMLINLLKENSYSEQKLLDIIYCGIVAFVCFWMVDKFWLNNEIPEWVINETPHLKNLYFSSIGTNEYSAQIFSVFVPVTIYIISQMKGFYFKLINMILLLITVQIMFLSHSRGILISLLFSSILTGMLNKGCRKIFYAVAGLILLFAANFIFFPEQVNKTIEKIKFSKNLNELSGGRINIYFNTFDMIKGNPLGVGAGNFEYIHPLYAKACTSSTSPDVSEKMVLSDPHNIFLKEYAELGFFGGTLFFLLFFFLSFIAIKNAIYGGWKDGILCMSWISLVTHSMFSAVFLTPATLFFGSIILALILFASKDNESPVWFEIKISKPIVIFVAVFSTIVFCAAFTSDYYLSIGIKNSDTKALNKSLTFNPDNERAYFELAVNLFLFQKKSADALSNVDQFLELYPYHIGGINLKADILLSMNENEKARDVILQSLSLCPENERMRALLRKIDSEKNKE